MRPRLLTVLATGALTLSLLGPTGAQADPPEIAPGPSLPEQASATARERAGDALDRGAGALRQHALPRQRDSAESTGSGRTPPWPSTS